MELGKIEFYVRQPSSTFLVYLLGALVILAGIKLLVTQGQELSKFWWGIYILFVTLDYMKDCSFYYDSE